MTLAVYNSAGTACLISRSPALPEWLDKDQAGAISAVGVSTALVTAGAVPLMWRGLPGGALILIEDLDGRGPCGFAAESLGLLEAACGVFIMDHAAFRNSGTSAVEVARSAIVAIIITSAARAATWRETAGRIAPDAVMMTSLGLGKASAAISREIGTA